MVKWLVTEAKADVGVREIQYADRAPQPSIAAFLQSVISTGYNSNLLTYSYQSLKESHTPLLKTENEMENPKQPLEPGAFAKPE